MKHSVVKAICGKTSMELSGGKTSTEVTSGKSSMELSGGKSAAEYAEAAAAITGRARIARALRRK